MSQEGLHEGNRRVGERSSYKFVPFKFELVEPHENCRHPQPRSGHRIVSDENYIYCFGGFNPDVPLDDEHMAEDPVWNQTKPLFQEVWQFSKTTRTWTHLATTGEAPRELASHCALLWPNSSTLMVYGGSGVPFGQASSNKMFLCDLKSAHWSQVEYANSDADLADGIESEVPDPAYGQAIVADKLNHCLYICGGTNGFDYSLDVHRFDWNTKKWSRLSQSPNNVEARYRHEMALWNNKLFIIGGGTSSRSFSTESIPVFDLITRKWSNEPTTPFTDPQTGQRLYPKPRYSHDCGQHGEHIFMVGGTNEAQIFADLWSLHLPSLTWTLHSNNALPKPLYFHSAAISDEGELYVFGGVTSLISKTRVNTVYKSWVRVPSLKTLARETILFDLRRMLALDGSYHPKKHRERALRKAINGKHLSVGTIEKYLTSQHIHSNVFGLPVV